MGGNLMKELIFGLIGGTALLMYGVDMMGEGLEKASGNMMKKILTVLTGRIWSAFLVGILLTALVQSSTAITVLTVGFVNAGLMKLPQAIGIIYGSNIGTTITAQLMAFSFSFKLTDIALPVLGIGFAISYFAKNKTIKHVGEALMGFGLMFLGLKILNSGVPFMKTSPTLRYFFETYASNPIIGMLLGALATALVHSSSATVGLVMVLGQAGLIDLTTSVAIMLGDNVGTCITAQLTSLTGNIHARRTAWAHTLYNVFGVLICAILLYPFVNLIEFVTNYLQPGSDISAQIANSHTVFNVVSAILFLPITKYYVKFLETVIRSKKGDEDKAIYLNQMLLTNPIAAFKATLSEITRGAELSKTMVSDIMNYIKSNDTKSLTRIEKYEGKINTLQKEVTSYIVEISHQSLTHNQSLLVPTMISRINDVERIGDHVIEIKELINNSQDKHLEFTENAQNQLKIIEDTIIKMFDNTILSLKNHDSNLAKETLKMEDTIDSLTREFELDHMKRLHDGDCSVESGILFLDILAHLERIADYVYKICISLTDDLKPLIEGDSKAV
ncbi:MAG: Na/Pi cotransporter family protein [Clostridium lundense]|nr:Na/Pi cotransporter family protein [Clostridium lundense]